MKAVSTKQLCFITIILFTIGKFNFMPALSARYLAEGLWVSPLINLIIDFVLLVFVLKLLVKNEDVSFFNFLKNKFGRPLATAIAITLSAYLALKSLIPLLEEKAAIELTFYESQPSELTFLPIFIIIFYVAVKGINAFSRSIEIVIWFFGASVLTLGLLSTFGGDYFNLLPILNHRPKTYALASYNTALWFGDPLMLLFFMGKIKFDRRFYSKAFISYAVYAFILLTGFIVAYAVFGSITERQYYLPLKISKYSPSLSNVGRFDYISTMMLVMASVFQLSAYVLLAAETLNDAFSIRKKFLLPAVITVLIAGVTVVLGNGFFDTLRFTQKYFAPFFIAVCYALPIAFFIPAHKTLRRDKV